MVREVPQDVRVFQEAVLGYYAVHGRRLPWRATTDVYEVLVSEVMLQQTQVDRVVPKYEAFLERFPDAASLACAPLRDVLALWQGLGYNNRAKRLQQAAIALAEHPAPSVEELEALPGVGPYTAAAVAAFAYNADVAAVDVNVRRVFDRYFGAVEDGFIASVVPSGRSREWHNALMDFGATLCTKRRPACSQCPLASSCVALREDAFAAEPSASQGRFLGTARWHRGQVLKRVLEAPLSREELWASLRADVRDEQRFAEALEGLLADAMLTEEDGRFRIPR